MAGSLRPVAAAGHAAPATATCPRGVLEDPAAPVVGADPEPPGVARCHGIDERFGKPGKRALHRIPDVAMARHEGAIRLRELDHRPRPEQPIDRGDGRICRWAPRHERLDHLANRVPGVVQVRQQVALARVVQAAQRSGFIWIEEAVPDQPRCAVPERREGLDPLPALLKLMRVQELKGGFDRPRVAVISLVDLVH